MKEDYITKIKDAERRFFAPQMELRASEEGKESRTIRGYAALFNSDSESFGSWIERIAPGAFDDVLDDDAVALFNHDPNLILARNKKTLKIGVDSKGLWYEFDAPNTTAGNDLLENIQLENVRSSSFAFQTKEEKWTFSEDQNQPDVRTIMKLERLLDVSPVTYPAYPDTTVGQRSYQAVVKEEERAAKKYLVNLMARQRALAIED